MTEVKDKHELATVMVTMDVVDELRHREDQLADASRRAYGHHELKQRLVELYRAQGIEVADEVLEAGIMAQREQRFVYTPPTGFRVRLAMLWIGRAKVGKTLAGALLAATSLWAGWHYAWTVPVENQALKATQALGNEAGMLPDRILSLAARFNAAQIRLDAATEAVSRHEQAGRLTAIQAEASAERPALENRINTGLAQAQVHSHLPGLVRVNRVTQFVGDQPAWAAGQPPEEAMSGRLAEINTHLEQVEGDVGLLERQAGRLEHSLVISGQLEQVNQVLIGARLPSSIDQVRDRYHAAAVASLRAADLQEAQVALKRLGHLDADAKSVASTTNRLQELGRIARATGVAGADLAEIRAQESRVVALNTVESTPEATEALMHLEASVDMLQGNYTYRVVNRQGIKSGVWRYHDNSPTTRNYYLVVQALDGQGKTVKLPIRSEETGQTELVDLFAVRVPEEQYNKVAQDKLDNGIIDQDIVATKPQGRLSANFEIPTAGGFITSW